MDTTPKPAETPKAPEQPKAEWEITQAPRLIPQYEAGENAGRWEVVLAQGKREQTVYGDTSEVALEEAKQFIKRGK